MDNIIKHIDTPFVKIVISLCLGLILGITYQYVSPKIVIINMKDNTQIKELENKSFKDVDKCYRYKKIVNKK
jgi:hypothetical protein